MEDPVHTAEADSSTDIFFDCPNCSKSLSIDHRGAGFIVTCPDCGTQIQVPESSPRYTTSEVTSLSANIEELRKRTEKLRSLDRSRFEQISKELVLIQSAVDRIVTLVEEALAAGFIEKPHQTE